jgi:Cu+-exporting ATPase
MKQKFDVTGMSCAACSARIEKCVAKLDGVDGVAVNLLANSMVVDFDEGTLGTGEIVDAVVKAGYGASPKTEAGTSQPVSAGGSVNAAEAEAKSMKIRLIASIIFFVPLFYISMGHMIGLPQPGFLMGLENAVTYGMTQLVLTLILMYINRKYYESGFPAFLHKAPNMDSLIAVGSLAAVIYGIFAIIRIGYGLAVQDWDLVEQYHMDMYFESAGTILTLITVGKYLEARSKGKTTDAVSRLLDMSPDTAIVERDGEETEVRIEDVCVGDILIVKPGSRVPVDGVIVEGESSIDESFITGESIPADKSVGDSVTGASVNKSGFFKMRAERVGEDTALAKIIQLVEDAGGSKAPIAKLADRIAGVFVPAVMVIALLSAVIWLLTGQTFEFALSTGIAVLVISCPCALGLATPAAIMAGTGRGAELGVLYKNAEILENTRSIDTVVMDKTGTLTTGMPGVTGIVLTAGSDEKEFLRMAAAVEKQSEHPLAQAIVNQAEAMKIEIPAASGFEAVHGKGVKGTVEGRKITAGNARMMNEAGIDISAFNEKASEYAGQGATPLFFAVNGQSAGMIAVADTVRPESDAAVREFSKMGIDVIMLTGDNSKTADAIAAKLGITHVRSEILPEDKEKEVRTLMESGHRTAMIGDGINDAPALARADVGIAIGAGTDVAIESADVVLMKSSPLDAVSAMQLARAVIRNVKMNLFWAFFYNIIGIPIAAGVLYPFFSFKLNPMIGAAAMSLSSFCVVSNALRLRFFRPSEGVRLAAEQMNSNAEDNGAALKAESYKVEIIAKSNVAAAPAAVEEIHMEKILNVEGMMCKNCVAHVEKALKGIDGVTDAKADLDAKTATVTLSADVADDVLVKAVTEEGYEAKMA